MENFKSLVKGCEISNEMLTNKMQKITMELERVKKDLIYPCTIKEFDTEIKRFLYEIETLKSTPIVHIHWDGVIFDELDRVHKNTNEWTKYGYENPYELAQAVINENGYVLSFLKKNDICDEYEYYFALEICSKK